MFARLLCGRNHFRSYRIKLPRFTATSLELIAVYKKNSYAQNTRKKKRKTENILPTPKIAINVIITRLIIRLISLNSLSEFTPSKLTTIFVI